MNRRLFKPFDMLRINVQDTQRAQFEAHSPEAWGVVFSGLTNPATFLLADGDIAMLAGLEIMENGEAVVWALLGARAGQEMAQLTREARRYLDAQNAARIVMLVVAGHDAGKRWATLLGFHWDGQLMEMPEGMAVPAGSPYFIYVYERGAA